MKRHKFIYILTIFALFLGACKEDEFSTIAPDGDYAVNFDFPTSEVFAPAKVVLTNRSKYTDTHRWRFPEAKTVTSSGLADITTSDKLSPDTIYYALPGTYKVTLVASQGGKTDSITKEINIKKRQPNIIIPANIGIMQEVQFSANVFQYPGVDVTYSWEFGEPGLTSTEAAPKVVFNNEGIHTVTLTINDGQETLSTTSEVIVMGELAKTLYFTDAITKKIYKYRFTTLKPPVVTATNITTGLHPLSLNIYNDRIYIAETGKGLRFSTGANALADGKLYSYDLNGGNEITLTTSETSVAATDYRDDPWIHTFDESGNIWWTSRNNAVRVLPANGSEVIYPAAKISLTAANAGVSVANHFDGGVQYVNNEIWLSKTGPTGKGIFRFTTAGAFVGQLSGGIQNYPIRSFVVDKVNSKIYFVVNIGTPVIKEGLYRADIDGSNVVPLDIASDMTTGGSGFSAEGSANEYIYITGLSIDLDANDGSGGYIYYGYRSNLDITGDPNSPTITATQGANSGIKRYALNGSKQPEFLLKGYAPYGIAIDQTRR